jgi:hypothetical protein
MNTVLDYIINNSGSIVLIMLALAISIVTIKVGISFDLNKHLERRRERFSHKAQVACPHMRIETNCPKYQSWFVSPPGTRNFICHRCGFVKIYLDDKEIERSAERFIRYPDSYVQALKEYRKFAQKSL